MLNKWLWTIFAFAVCALAISGYADRLGAEYASGALERALLTFAVARGLDGVISIAQGTEVALEPGGVGLNLTVGQILDPVNDLIERFSTVMLTVTAALGLQEILLRITASNSISLLLGITALLALLFVWVPALEKRSRLRTVVLRLFLAAFFVRFAVPTLVVGTHVVFDAFLASDQVAATAALEQASVDIEALSSEQNAIDDADDDRNWFERTRDRIGESLGALNVEARMTALQERASGVTRHIVSLIVIFLLQTIALPLGFLWLLLQGAKAVARQLQPVIVDHPQTGVGD
ncbi:MAG: hypothetical protein AAF578_05545 [Pseudomonadota bacterium]